MHYSSSYLNLLLKSGPGLSSPLAVVFEPLGEALYPHCSVPRIGLKDFGPLFTNAHQLLSGQINLIRTQK